MKYLRAKLARWQDPIKFYVAFGLAGFFCYLASKLLYSCFEL